MRESEVTVPKMRQWINDINEGKEYSFLHGYLSGVEVNSGFGSRFFAGLLSLRTTQSVFMLLP